MGMRKFYLLIRRLLYYLGKNKSEQDLVNHLNGKKFSDLDEALKKFVTMLNGDTEPDPGCMIYAERPEKHPPSSDELREDFPKKKTCF